MRRILEVGPALTPMHHRDEKGELALGTDELYTGVDTDLIFFVINFGMR